MFFFDSETHVWPPMDDISYFPNFKMQVQSFVSRTHSRRLAARGIREVPSVSDVEAVMRARATSEVTSDADALIQSMDEGGVQMACVIPEGMRDLSYGLRVRSTNGYVAKEIEKYPGRLVGVCNVGPILDRGIKNAIWELKYLVEERNFKGCKFYPPDEVPINDRELWPFYEKVQELGIVLFIHTGWSWVVPGRSVNCRPILLEDVCTDFPEIPIVAFHMGYPYNTELNMLAAKCTNLYVQTSLLELIGLGLTKQTERILGEAMAWASPDKIIWGTDWSGKLRRHKDDVKFLGKLQISEEVQRDYGYLPLSQEDKEKWAGLNLARLMRIEVPHSSQK